MLSLFSYYFPCCLCNSLGNLFSEEMGLFLGNLNSYNIWFFIDYLKYQTTRHGFKTTYKLLFQFIKGFINLLMVNVSVSFLI